MLSVRGPAARALPRPDPLGHLVALAVLAGSLTAGMFAADPRLGRVAFALSVAALVVGLALRSPRSLLLALPVWLAALGLTRRLLSAINPHGEADPLLLVGPLALVLLLGVSMTRLDVRTPLAKAVLVLSLLVLVGAVNPLQGSLFAGLSALVFFVPLAAFWVGRALCDDRTMRTVFLTFGVLAVPAALYGLYQTFAGFPVWDQRWIEENGYVALNVRGATRPFSAFSNGSEYASFVAVGVVAWLAFVRSRAIRPLALCVVGLLVVAVVYQASRGAVVLLIAGVAVMLAARRGLSLPAAAAALAALLVALPFAIERVGPSSFGDDAPSRLLEHVVDGLGNPFNPESSTAKIHLRLLTGGLESVLVNPVGYGISTVTIAGSKFGGGSYNTEADPSNAAVALGLPGLLAYLVVLGVGFSRAYRLAARRADAVAVAVVGILGVNAFQWLNGGKYAVAFLPWLALGWVDRTWEREQSRKLRGTGSAA